MSFASLLHWYVSGFDAETPERMHARGVWFGPPSASIALELVGGSLLGAPRIAGAVRQLIENSPHQVYDRDLPEARYARPMRSALARLGEIDHDGAFMARYLVQVGYSRGDWRSVSHRWFPGLEFVHRPYCEQALIRLTRYYEDEPPARILPGWVDLSESQQRALMVVEIEGAG